MELELLVSGDGPSRTTPTERAVYKPGRGERPLWDYPGGLFRREVAAYELSAALGLDIVPETVLRADGPHGEGSVQRFVDADFAEHYFTLLNEPATTRGCDGSRPSTCLPNNGDRKGGHSRSTRTDRIWGIDNGLCFHVERKLRTVMWDFAGEELPAEVLGGCELVAEEVPDAVAAVLEPDECAGARRRAVALLRRPRYPSPATTTGPIPGHWCELGWPAPEPPGGPSGRWARNVAYKCSVMCARRLPEPPGCYGNLGTRAIFAATAGSGDEGDVGRRPLPLRGRAWPVQAGCRRQA